MSIRSQNPWWQWKGPRFTIRSALVLILFVGLTFAWLSDRRRLESRYRTEHEQREQAETVLQRLSAWYAANHSLEALPDDLREVVAEAPVEVVDPEEGYRLFRVRDAEATLAHVGLKGDSFRIRGGPLQYEFVAEEFSGEESRVIYRHVGSAGAMAHNTDGVLTFSWPRMLFKPFRRGVQREPAEEPYRFSFADGSFQPILVPIQDVWPDWIYAAEEKPGPTRAGGVLIRDSVIPANETVTMFFQEMVASDGRKARVRLIVTCQPQVSGEENHAEGETSAL